MTTTVGKTDSALQRRDKGQCLCSPEGPAKCQRRAESSALGGFQEEVEFHLGPEGLINSVYSKAPHPSDILEKLGITGKPSPVARYKRVWAVEPDRALTVGSSNGMTLDELMFPSEKLDVIN